MRGASGRPTGVVGGPDETRRKVRELVRAGADVIKIATSGGGVSPRGDPGTPTSATPRWQ